MDQNRQAEIELTDAQLEMVTGGYSQKETHHEDEHHEDEHQKKDKDDYPYKNFCHWVWRDHHWTWLCNR
jgi:hypothetical protein